MTEAAIRRAFGVLRDVAKDPDRFQGDLLVLPLETLLGEEGSPFSKQRLRLLMEIRRQVPQSLDDLAHRLHREKTRVSKDVKFLEGLGLVRSRTTGKAKRIEPTGQAILIA
jgi:DNA-binding MarR family transcriptional regulator